MPASPKRRVFQQFARIGRALGSPHRLELLDLLAQGERTVEALAQAASLAIANASHHLQILRQAGLVETRKEGLYVHYRLAGLDVFEGTRALRALAERRLGEMDRIADTFFKARDEMDPIGREELLARTRAGTALVIDVRPAEEYRAGHIPGAVSIPVGELERRMRELPAGKEIVAYCRGPYCVMAFKAVELLRAKRRHARRLEDGFPEWRAAGLPVEEGAA